MNGITYYEGLEVTYEGKQNNIAEIRGNSAAIQNPYWTEDNQDEEHFLMWVSLAELVPFEYLSPFEKNMKSIQK